MSNTLKHEPKNSNSSDARGVAHLYAKKALCCRVFFGGDKADMVEGNV